MKEDNYFPPPWNIYENPEKTQGWIEFQKALQKDLKYYLMNIEKSLLKKLFINDSEKNGNLILTIDCFDCKARFEINPETVALALVTSTSVWEWIQAIQNSRCRVCDGKSDNLL